MIVYSLLIISHMINIAVSIKLTGKIFSYLALSNVIVLFNLIGTLANEYQIYHSHEASLLLVLFASVLNFGAFIYNSLFGKRLRKAISASVNSCGLQLASNELDIRVVIASLLAFFCAAGMFFYTVGIPLFMDDLAFARRDVQEGANLYYRIFLYMIPVSTLILYVKYKVYDDAKLKNYFVIFFSLTSSLLLMLGYKGYVLWYVVLVLMIMNIYTNKIYKQVMLLFCVGLFFAVIATSVTYQVSYSDALKLLILRSTQVSALGYNIAIYELLPVVDIMGSIPLDLNSFLAVWKFGNNSDLALHSMGITITLIGALVIHLGKLWALFLTFLIGFVMQYLYYLTMKYKSSPLLIILPVYITYVLVGVVNRGTIQNVLIQPIPTLVILVSLYMLLDALLSGDFRYSYTKVRTR